MLIREFYEQLDEERSALIIEVDGVQVLRFIDGESEDNLINRNFCDIHKITDLFKEIHEAGKEGEEFQFEYINLTNLDEEEE